MLFLSSFVSGFVSLTLFYSLFSLNYCRSLMDLEFIAQSSSLTCFEACLRNFRRRFRRYIEHCLSLFGTRFRRSNSVLRRAGRRKCSPRHFLSLPTPT